MAKDVIKKIFGAQDAALSLPLAHATERVVAAHKGSGAPPQPQQRTIRRRQRLAQAVAMTRKQAPPNV